MNIKELNTSKKEKRITRKKTDYRKPKGWKKIELYHDSDWNEFKSRKELDHPSNPRLRRLYHNTWYLHQSSNCECCRGKYSRMYMLQRKNKKEKFRKEAKKVDF